MSLEEKSGLRDVLLVLLTFVCEHMIACHYISAAHLARVPTHVSQGGFSHTGNVSHHVDVPQFSSALTLLSGVLVADLTRRGCRSRRLPLLQSWPL